MEQGYAHCIEGTNERYQKATYRQIYDSTSTLCVADQWNVRMVMWLMQNCHVLYICNYIWQLFFQNTEIVHQLHLRFLDSGDKYCDSYYIVV